MTDQEISRLGPAFSSYLGRFRPCFLQDRTAGHFDDYCRGLLSDLPRKSVEPIALVSGTAVRTLQEFLVTPAGTTASPATRSSGTSPASSRHSRPTSSARSASSTRPVA